MFYQLVVASNPIIAQKYIKNMTFPWQMAKEKLMSIAERHEKKQK